MLDKLTVIAVKNQNGPVYNAHLAELFLLRIPNLVIEKMTMPKPAARPGAIPKPAKMVARPLPSFHPQLGALIPLEKHKSDLTTDY